MNENDIERQLQRQPLAQPSTHLDQRINTLFREASTARPSIFTCTVPVWMATAACLVCGVAGLGARSLFIPRQNPPTVIYFVPPNEAMTRFLTGASNRNDGFDFSHARVQVIKVPSTQGDQL